jgi:hypothetical protein
LTLLRDIKKNGKDGEIGLVLEPLRLKTDNSDHLKKLENLLVLLELKVGPNGLSFVGQEINQKTYPVIQTNTMKKNGKDGEIGLVLVE